MRWFVNFSRITIEGLNSLNAIFKLFIVVSFAIALVGQAFAYAAMSCDMAKHGAGHHDMTDMAMMHDEHAGHHATHGDDVEKVVKVEDPCCDSDCVCPTTGCGSAMFLTVSFSDSAECFSENSVSNAHNLSIKRFSNSLYRPPILA